MGAEQSSPRGADASQDPPKKKDYYEVLGVSHAATDDEIKKAYRKRALELHPDRNFGDVENATRKFAEVQAAYEVLADHQERAWYDSHSDAILRGDDPAGSDAVPEYRNVRLTTADDIFTLMGRFNKSVPLDDSPNSFFTVLRENFDRLADGEYAAVDWEGLPPTAEYPSFGESTDGEATAKAFYSRWSNFSTRLSFAWKDKWRLSDAPDRRVRRLMEKDNKKLREDAIHKFNDAVRSLVIFVRKRDPRHIPNNHSEAERQQILRDSATAQAARSRAANQEKMKDAAADAAVPEWARSRPDDSHGDEFSESEEESEVEEIECVVCKKTFKSENQFEAHAKSKKHLKAVQQLKRQMKKEDANFDLSEPAQSTGAAGGKRGASKATTEDSHSITASIGEEEIEGSGTQAPSKGKRGKRSPLDVKSASTGDDAVSSNDSSAPNSDAAASEEDDDYASRDAVEARLAGAEADVSLGVEDAGGDSIKTVTDKAAKLAVNDEGDENSNGLPPTTKKIGMAKAKKMKKATRQAAADKEGHSCFTCRATFDSKGGLFKHIKESPDHAAPKSGGPPSAAKSGKSSGKKR